MASTLLILRNLVKEYGKAGGPSFTSMTAADSTEIDRAILRGLQSFSRYTYCLYSTTGTFSTTASTYNYSVSGFFSIDNIDVGGIILRNDDAGQGPESLARFFRHHPTWRTDPLGPPTKYVLLPQNRIHLYPTPGATYTVNLAGYIEHPTFTLGTAGTGITLSIEDHVLDLAALWCALQFMYPHAQGETLFQQVMTLDQLAAQRLDEYKAHNRALTAGHVKRGSSQVRRFYS